MTYYFCVARIITLCSKLLDVRPRMLNCSKSGTNVFNPWTGREGPIPKPLLNGPRSTDLEGWLFT